MATFGTFHTWCIKRFTAHLHNINSSAFGKNGAYQTQPQLPSVGSLQVTPHFLQRLVFTCYVLMMLIACKADMLLTWILACVTYNKSEPDTGTQ